MRRVSVNQKLYMQNLGWQARIYIGGTIFAGAALYLWHFGHLQIVHPTILVILSIFAVIAHILRVEGATVHSSYQLSWIAYGASFVLLEPAEAMLVLVVAHIAEWFWHKPTWYIALFNLNAFGIVASISILVWQAISAGSTPFTPVSTLAFLAMSATFTAVNHLLVGLVIWLARGESLMQSGVFHLLTLMIDFVSFGIGIASGLIWLVNPYAVVFILSPLYLLYTTMQVPALQQQTRIEPKTGLYNAKYFFEVLNAELERAAQSDRPLTVVMADVDLLRNINNTYGHLAGDKVLIGVADILRQSVREHDIVARFGGEEYAILLPETSLCQALPMIERMRAAIAAAQFEISTSVTPISVTMSFGVAAREEQGQQSQALIHHADLAVYAAKATTRNRVCYFMGGQLRDFSSGSTLTCPSAAMRAAATVHWPIESIQQSHPARFLPESTKIALQEAIVLQPTTVPDTTPVAQPLPTIWGELQSRIGMPFEPVAVTAFRKVMQMQDENAIDTSAAATLPRMTSGGEFSLLPIKASGADLADDESVNNLFLSELDSINMALHNPFAGQRRMEVSAQEGRELAETLLRVASTINTTLEQDRVLALILEQLAHVVQYDSASIMLLEEDSLNSVARRSIHVPESQFMSVRTDMLAHVSEVLENKQAVVITDTYNDNRWMRRQGSENIRCWLGVPLLVQDRVIGLLNLSTSIPGSYTDHHVQVSVAFAAHASVAIENARLYTQAQQEIEERERAQAALRQSEAHLQERVIELQRAKAAEQKQRELAETLSEAARSMSASLQIQEVVHTIVVYLSRLVASDRIHVKLLHDSKVELFASYARPTNEYHYADGSSPLSALEERVIQQAKPYVIKDAQQNLAWDPATSDHALQSWVSVPLTVQDKVVGLLTLAKAEANFYTEHDVSLVGAFANQSAITVTNARLYQQLQNELAERMRAEQALQEERGLLAERVEERTFELKAANNKLTAALRTKDEFLATVSHELRTPLSAILLLTESMQKGVYGVLGERHSDVLTTVKQSARHLLALINDILDMSRIESGMFELDMGPVSLPIICRNSLQLVEESAYKKQITLVQKIDQSVDSVNGDERRILQILVNLLGNAMKFTPEGGEVGLEVVGDAQNRLVHLTVWDTGIGIAKEDITRLFQPFVQLDSKLSRHYEGTGLGLALVDRLTQMHGGTVALTSEVGKGSRFTVSIPWEPQQAVVSSFTRFSGGNPSAMAKIHELQKPAANVSPTEVEDKVEIPQDKNSSQPGDEGNGDSPLILLVEDNEIGIEAMQDYLIAYAYRVIIARTGEEAIAQTNQHHPDLILMDVQMPDMDGLEATMRIRTRQELTHIPIIALTALAMPGDRERCIKAGANEYLSKPVSMKQLVQVIKTQLQLTKVPAG